MSSLYQKLRAAYGLNTRDLQFFVDNLQFIQQVAICTIHKDLRDPRSSPHESTRWGLTNATGLDRRVCPKCDEDASCSGQAGARSPGCVRSCRNAVLPLSRAARHTGRITFPGMAGSSRAYSDIRESGDRTRRIKSGQRKPTRHQNSPPYYNGAARARPGIPESRSGRHGRGEL